MARTEPAPHVALLAATLGLLAAVVLLTGCGSIGDDRPGRPPPSMAGIHGPEDTRPSSLGLADAWEAEALSFADERLLGIVEEQERLFARIEARGRYRVEDLSFRVQSIAQRYEEFLAQNPDHVLALILYGKLLRRVGEREYAHLMFLRAGQERPDLAVVHQQVGNYYAEEGRYGQALQSFLRAVELAPEEAVYHFALGELLHTYRAELIGAAIYSEAEVDAGMHDAFRQAADLAPDDFDLQFRYGESFYDLPAPDWETALAHWDALATRPDLRPFLADAVRLHRAQVLLRMDRFAEARAAAAAVTEPTLSATREALLVQIDHAADQRG